VANERVHFRLIICPACNHNLCWFNPRLPSYCPECGKHIYPAVRGAIYVSDAKAELRYDVDQNVDVAKRGAADLFANGKFARPNVD
jgi:ribosomal protein S27E